MNSIVIRKALKSRSRNWVFLIRIAHPDGDIYLNNGFRNVDHDFGDGLQVWTGIGTVSAIELPESSSAIEISKFSISLNNVHKKYLFLADEQVRGNQIQFWRAYLNDQGQVISSVLHEDGIQDRVIDKHNDDGSVTLKLECIGNFAFLANQHIGRWTPEHQRTFLLKRGIDPATDIGFDDQHGIPDQNAAWYRP